MEIVILLLVLVLALCVATWIRAHRAHDRFGQGVVFVLGVYVAVALLVVAVLK